MSQIGSLNGTWDRCRRLFRMGYGGDIPKDITPVWIAGDVREPFGQAGAYRRFLSTWTRAIPAGSSLHLRGGSDVVLERVAYTFSGGTPSVRMASGEQLNAAGVTGWASIPATNGVWRDSPDSSLIPMDFVELPGAVGNTAVFASIGGGVLPILEDCYLPTGSDISWYSPGAISTVSIVLHGYVRSN